MPKCIAVWPWVCPTRRFAVGVVDDRPGALLAVWKMDKMGNPCRSPIFLFVRPLSVAPLPCDGLCVFRAVGFLLAYRALWSLVCFV